MLTKMNVVVRAVGTVFFMLFEAAGGSRRVSCKQNRQYRRNRQCRKDRQHKQ